MVRDIGAVGGLEGAGTGTRAGVQAAATLAAKFLGFEIRWSLHTMQAGREGVTSRGHDIPNGYRLYVSHGHIRSSFGHRLRRLLTCMAGPLLRLNPNRSGPPVGRPAVLNCSG